jgi:hypothetical protein
MLASQNNPRFAALSDSELSALYVSTRQSFNADTMDDAQLEAIDTELFWIDDELCARGLDLPR